MPRNHNMNLNEMKLAIKEAVEPLVQQLNRHEQTLYGETGNNGLRGRVEGNSKEFDQLRAEFQQEKAKIKTAVAIVSAIGASVGAALSIIAKALFIH